MKLEIASPARVRSTAVAAVYPELCDPVACETFVQFGFFFDGTLNNLATDRPGRSHSNVARLSLSYLHDPDRNIYRFYVPGVGSRFEGLGIPRDEWFGQSFGVGCEIRMHYACAMLLNTLHRVRTSQDFFPVNDSARMYKLCDRFRRSGKHPKTVDDLYLQTQYMLAPASRSKVKIKECIIDVFGFSRGAATARAFCNRVNGLVESGRLDFTKITFRFLGLFDTVAASGLGKHDGWANPENLKVPKPVRNCVHMVAMHELRGNFPVDLIETGREHWIELGYPGSHSDVGGGYEPGELGVPQAEQVQEREALQLAQVPLNDMYQFATRAGVPLNRKTAGSDFLIAPTLARDYSHFIEYFGSAPRALNEWLVHYLIWRWQCCRTYQSSKQVSAASPRDRTTMLAYNEWLAADAALLARSGSVADMFLRIVRPRYGIERAAQDAAFSGEAQQVFERVRTAKALPAKIADFFDCYVHDSLAGFNLKSIELSGYWRFRRAYRGSADALVASHHESEEAAALA